MRHGWIEVCAAVVLLSIILPISKAATKGTTTTATAIFERVHEQREDAFTILIPKGWITEGGIFRIDPTAAGGAMQSIAAKCDFSVKRDASGSAMFRSLPDMLYFDMSYSPAGQMGLFPPGSNYNGMTVYPLMSAQQFIAEIVFPYAHPGASQVEVLEQRNLPELAQKCLQLSQITAAQMTFSYDAALTTVTYNENGAQYKERIVEVIENWGAIGAGTWGNKETSFIRAPVNEFEQLEPIFSIIQGSVQINPQWLAGELRGQMQRSQIAAETQRQIAEIDRQITEHRQAANAEIHNDMFLTLTDQEEYINPFTKEVEVGSNQWKYRWQDESGNIVYSDNADYDPNHDLDLNKTGFKRSEIRPRKP